MEKKCCQLHLFRTVLKQYHKMGSLHSVLQFGCLLHFGFYLCCTQIACASFVCVIQHFDSCVCIAVLFVCTIFECSCIYFFSNLYVCFSEWDACKNAPVYFFYCKEIFIFFVFKYL